MTIVRILEDHLEPLAETTIAAEGLRERRDLQRLLMGQISVIDPNLLVIAEEFGSWEESRRRIDLLAVDREANLVVIELERDDDAHMELQAIRYAAMVSPMTFDRVVATYEDFLQRSDADTNAREELLSFLGYESEEGEPSIGDARIVLVASEFSKELTTAVLWLNDRGLEITCVRLKPYRDGGALYADVQQILPLREAQDYITGLREKRRDTRSASGRRLTLDELTAQMDPSDAGVARDLIAWSHAEADSVRTATKGFAAVWTIEGRNHRVFRVRTDGQVLIRFDLLKRLSPPFETEESRLRLQAALNEIPGVRLDRVGGKPGLPIRLLEKPEAMATFRRIVLAAIDEIRAAAG